MKMTREEAVKWLENLKSDIGKMQFQALWHYGQAIDEIIKLLSAEPKWIPCSERLPSAEREGQVRGFYLTTNERGQVSVKAFEFTDAYVEYGWNSDLEILAWMPLPKPYGERKEE